MRAKEFTPGSQDLVIFDIDDTLLHTTAKIKVVKDQQIIKDLSNQEFNNYQLQPGEEFDFGEFRNAEKFRQESKPIAPMVRKLKTIMAHAGNAKIIMLTARADFDDKDKFLQTFKDIGIDMSRIHVHRAGNLPGNQAPAYKKAVWVRKYLDTKQYGHVRLYDDSMSNLRVFKELQKEYPTVDFRAIYVGPEGNTQTIEEAKKRKKKKSKVRFGAYGPGPYGWYGSSVGYSGDGGGGGGDGGGESVQNESADHSDNDSAVSQLKTALLSKKQQLKTATDDQVYNIIDKIMTDIAKTNNISGKQLHNQWVKQYKQVPDTWIMKENFADGKNPQDKGDSKRHGINTKASVSSLRKTAKSGGRKGQLAHWLANMKSGRAKKNK